MTTNGAHGPRPLLAMATAATKPASPPTVGQSRPLLAERLANRSDIRTPSHTPTPAATPEPMATGVMKAEPFRPRIAATTAPAVAPASRLSPVNADTMASSTTPPPPGSEVPEDFTNLWPLDVGSKLGKGLELTFEVRNLIPQPGGILEPQSLGRLMHLRLK